MRSDNGGEDRSKIKVRRPMPNKDQDSNNPKEEAERLLHCAYGESEPAKRLAFAKQALALSADCADAYVLLAREGTEDLLEKIALYRKGVDAAERTLGPRAFERNVGHFWGILEARPYLRARFGLAETLWQAGEHKEALEHYRVLLKLNPGDHQSVRYRLMLGLLTLKIDEAAETLLRRYEDEISVVWVYTAALVSFRRHGDTKAGCKLRDRAVQLFPKGATFLLHRSRIPADEALCFGLPAEHRDAIAYAREYGEFWDKTNGALSWLASKAEPERAAVATSTTRAINASDLLKIMSSDED